MRYTLVLDPYMGTATRYDIIFGTRWDAFQLYRDDPLMLVNEAQLGESWRSVEELVEYCDRVEIRRMGDIYAVPKIGMYPWQARQSLTFKSLAPLTCCSPDLISI